MNFHVMTLFPEMVMNGLNTSILGRAASNGLLSFEAINIRDYTLERHGKVDDYPYGGGAGMVMQAEPIYRAYTALCDRIGHRPRVVYMTPQGRTFTQKIAEELAKEEELVFLCGHYRKMEAGAVHYPDSGTETGAFGGSGALQKGKALPGGAFEKKGGKPGRRYDLVLAIWTDICYNHKP